MTFVIGRADGDDDRPTGRLGTYRALDGSDGAPLALDLDGPHAVLVVGKRGYGKSYTLGVLAEILARAPGVAPVVVDPMGVLTSLAEPAGEGAEPVPATVVDDPAVPPSGLDPKSWCALLELPPQSGPGSLVWRAAAAAGTLDGMADHVAATDAPAVQRRAAVNHLRLAESWGVFDPGGLAATDLAGPAATVLDLSTPPREPRNAVVRTLADELYRARVTDAVDRFPWVLVDEAHAFFDGVAAPGLERLLARGRAPGVSLVLATQRPSAVPEVAVSQSDVLVVHRLTARTDLDALSRARPRSVGTPLEERLPTGPGEVLVVDDATETVHAARIRRRDTPHDGGTPSVSESLDTT